MDQPSGSPISAPTPQGSPNQHPLPSTSDTPADTRRDASTPIGIISRPTKPSSCYACRRRKGRCDRQNPCSYCKRVNITCVYPTRRAPRGSLLPENHPGRRKVDLVDRLRKLEGLVDQLKGAVDVNTSGDSPTAFEGKPLESTLLSPFQPAPSSDQSTPDPGSFGDPKVCNTATSPEGEHLRRGFGRMVVDDRKGTARYVSSAFWTKLNDELDSIRGETQELVDEYYEEPDLETSPDSTDGMSDYAGQGEFMFAFSSTNVDLLKLHPLPSHVQLLWSIYQENVEPMVKMFHIPTTHQILRTARDHPSNLTPGQHALVFSIYHAAITSLEPEEVQSYFNAKKEVILPRHRFAVEQALAKANIVNTSDITVVQAFAIFLTVVRRHDPSRFCWSMTGLLVHIARGMGLHRDGSHFNLSPFETEMRRRLWWCLIILDVRCSEEQGTALVILEDSFDTKMPSNIDDADLSPSSTEFPEHKEGKSDCTVAVIRFELCSFARRLADVLSAPNSESVGAGDKRLADKEAELVAAYQHLKSTIDKPILTETDNLYWVAVMLSRASIARLSIVLQQPSLFPNTCRSLPKDIHQQVFIATMEMLECNLVLNTNPQLSSFKWNFITWSHWHSIIFVLTESCRRPWTPLVERAWAALNNQERNVIEITRATNHTAVFFPLRMLYMMVQKRRSVEIARLRANLDEAYRLESEERIAFEQGQFVAMLSDNMKQAEENWHMMLRGIDPPPPPPRKKSKEISDQRMSSPLVQSTFPRLQAEGMPLNHPARQFPASMDLDIAINSIPPITNRMAQTSSALNCRFMPLMDNPTGNCLPKTAMETVSPSIVGNDSLVGGDTFMPEMSPDQQTTLPQMSQLPIIDNLPPWLRFDPSLLVDNTLGGEADQMDLNQLCGGFDWQTWSQDVKRMEDESKYP